MLLVVATALLGACASEYETFDPPPLDFSDRQPLSLAVDRVTIDSVYRPAGAPPYVDHALPLTPEAATRALLEQRLRAVGGADRLQAVILDASVEEEALEPASGVRGYLTTETAARLNGQIKVRVDRLDPDRHGGRLRSARRWPAAAAFPKASAMPSASASATSSCAPSSTTSMPA